MHVGVKRQLEKEPMSRSVLLQNWITVRGATTTTDVRQDRSGYADLAGYKDLVVYLEVSDLSGRPLLAYETSPTNDDVLFLNLDTAAFIPVVGVAAPKIFRFTSPLGAVMSRYVRWRLPASSGAPWSLTFRVWLSANLA
jgi:hypothetical protein